MDGETRPLSHFPPPLNFSAGRPQVSQYSEFHQNESEIVLAASHS
jgi:hypothetical protein